MTEIYKKWSNLRSDIGLINIIPITANTSSSCSLTNNETLETIIYTNSTSNDLTVTIPTTYKTPDGVEIELTCVAGGYTEVSYIKINGTIYARGL